jgi:peptidoglycan/LPS O-acetylase OafA/YrhL
MSRRALRLYPILLLALLVGGILRIEPVRETFLWHVTYLTNVYIVKLGSWPGSVSHLWSLAVEEQFYLFWPLVIFFLPRRMLPAILIILIASALIFRLAWRAAGLGDLGAWVLLPGSLDALAMGALLALLKEGARRPIDLIGLVGLCLWLAATQSRFGGWWIVLDGEIAATAGAMAFVWVIARASEGFDGIAGKILGSRALQYIGAVSYGIYVLHNFVPLYLLRLGVRPYLRSWQFTLLCVATTILLASFSRHFFERPIMRAGRRRIAAALRIRSS